MVKSSAEAKPEKIETQQVAQLVARAIEIVEYQRHDQRCDLAQQLTPADWSNQIIPGQDLGIKKALMATIGVSDRPSLIPIV